MKIDMQIDEPAGTESLSRVVEEIQRFALDRYARSIRDLRVRIAERLRQSGRREIACEVQVALANNRRVMTRHADPDALRSVSVAFERAARAIGAQLARRDAPPPPLPAAAG